MKEIIYQRLYNKAQEIKKLKEFAKLSQTHFRDNKIESCENINEILLSLNQYHDLVQENIFGNEEIFPKIKQENLDQNYLRFLTSEFAIVRTQ